MLNSHVNWNVFVEVHSLNFSDMEKSEVGKVLCKTDQRTRVKSFCLLTPLQKVSIIVQHDIVSSSLTHLSVAGEL